MWEGGYTYNSVAISIGHCVICMRMCRTRHDIRARRVTPDACVLVRPYLRVCQITDTNGLREWYTLKMYCVPWRDRTYLAHIQNATLARRVLIFQRMIRQQRGREKNVIGLITDVSEAREAKIGCVWG